jgi:hypothetical protein
VFDRSGVLHTPRLVTDPELSPLDLKVAPNGNIMVASEWPFGAPDAVASVREYDPVTGQLVRVFSPARSIGFRRPRGLRFGPGGRLKRQVMRRLHRGPPLGTLLAEAPPSPVEPHYRSAYRGHPGCCQLAQDYEQDDGCEDGEEGNQVRPWGRPGRRWYFTHGSSFRRGLTGRRLLISTRSRGGVRTRSAGLKREAKRVLIAFSAHARSIR